MLRLFTGINAQYIEHGRIILRAISLKEIFEKQTGSHIKSLVLAAVARCGITAKQIYSVTTDGGANQIKFCNMLVDDQENETDDPHDLNQVIEQVVTGMTSEEILLKSLEDIDFVDDNSVMVRGLRCAAHALQLAVQDALESCSGDLLNLISRSRELVKNLRTANVMFILRAQKLKNPIIDVETRWNSTSDMLERLLELQSFCEGIETTE